MKRLMHGGLLSAFAAAVLSAQSAAAGTDIRHFSVREDLTNDGVETNATGRVEAQQNEQGKANNQTFKLEVNGLAGNTTYSLLAATDGDPTLDPVTDFTTDENGGASIEYKNKAQHGNGKGKGKGKGNQNTLPDILNPVSQIQAVSVYNSSTQAVLSADLTAPGKLQYLIKRHITTNDIVADLRIKATSTETQFRLNASGLAPTNDYWLVFNGSIVQTNTTDGGGKLHIDSLVSPPTDILSVHSIQLWDTGTNVVLSTDVP